jgi:hypothetical protein
LLVQDLLFASSTVTYPHQSPRNKSNPSQRTCKALATTLSSTRPLVPSSRHSSMDSPKLDSGKGTSTPDHRGFRPQNAQNSIIKVQPPRREDLQPSYAQVLQEGETEAEVHGWYGSMSMLPLLQPHSIANVPQSTRSDHALVSSVPFHAALFAPTHTSPCRKATSV